MRMLIRSGHFAALLSALVLALPALADVRPVARPFAVAEPVPVLRPMPNPAYASAPLRMEIAVTATPLAAPPLAQLAGLVATSGALLPVDPPLLAAVRRAAQYDVVMSTAGTPVTPALNAPSLRPRPRPDVVQAVAIVAPPPALMVRPAPRPRALSAPPVAEEVRPTPAVAILAPSPRPEPRPRGLARKAAKPAEAEVVLAAVTPPLNPGKPLVKSKKGSVCGDPSIRGETIPPIPAKLKGCGIADPVRVTEIDGIRLSTPATINCTTAKAMKSWINAGLRPAYSNRNPPVMLNIAASYACRPRNNKPGNPVSEHGRGNAIDISGIVLKSGEVIDVLRDYRRNRPLQAAHKAACKAFGTTLGPGSDGYHENHLHFDVANMNRRYCR